MTVSEKTKPVTKRKKPMSKEERRKDARKRQMEFRKNRKMKGIEYEARFYGTELQINEIKKIWLEVTHARPRPEAAIEPAMPTEVEPDEVRPEAVISAAHDETSPLPLPDPKAAVSEEAGQKTIWPEFMLTEVRDDVAPTPKSKSADVQPKSEPPTNKKEKPGSFRDHVEFFS